MPIGLSLFKAFPGPPPTTAQLKTLVWIATRDDGPPNEPRVPKGEEVGGEWTKVGANPSTAKSGQKSKPITLHPQAINVGGDDWNKQTAVRLETEYQTAKEELDASVEKFVKDGPPTGIPTKLKDWSSLSSDQQEGMEEDYKENNIDSFHQSEIENWQSNGDAKAEAQEKVADEICGGDADQELDDVLSDLEEKNGKKFPFDHQQILHSIKVERFHGEATDYHFAIYDENNNDYFGLRFDNDQLKNPTGYDENQGVFEGVEKVLPEKYLTGQMRQQIAKAVMDKFEEMANEKAASMEPPDYLLDSAKELLDDAWDQLDDDKKFKYAKNYLDLEDYHKIGDDSTLELPEKFDPLNDTTGNDYEKTQRLAKTLSLSRAADLIVKRGLIKNPNHAGIIENVADQDAQIWKAWKSSSTSQAGKLLQMATAEELGGRLREETIDEKEREVMKRRADIVYKDIGGYKGLKAYIRAKWETTQWLLDKANVHSVDVYRAVNLLSVIDNNKDGSDALGKFINERLKAMKQKIQDFHFTQSDLMLVYKIVYEIAKRCSEAYNANDSERLIKELGAEIKTAGFDKGFSQAITNALQGVTPNQITETYDNAANKKDSPGYVQKIKDVNGREYEFLPNLTVQRNGAASTSTDPQVSNDWDGSNGRVVLRARVPRTACISVPAYGENIQSEHEVVVGGTAWTGWDVWKGRAPEFNQIALGGLPDGAKVAAPNPEQLASLNKLNAALSAAEKGVGIEHHAEV